MAWHGSLLDAKYAPSVVFSYLSGLEKAVGLATEKKGFSPSLPMEHLALSSNSVPMSSTVVGLLSVLDKQAECDAA